MDFGRADVPSSLPAWQTIEDAGMVANANPAATPSQATQIALADLLGRHHCNRRCGRDHGDHRVSEVGTQLRRAASLSGSLTCTRESILTVHQRRLPSY